MKIDGVTIPTPSDIEFNVSDIDGESYRGANGIMVRDRIATKRKLSCKWKVLTVAEMSLLQEKTSPTFFTLEFFDAKTGQNKTGKFYAGDKTSSVYSLVNGLPRWTDVSIDFVEQ